MPPGLLDLLRAGLNMSVGRWKALLVALALFSATVMVIESVAAAAASTRATTCGFGIHREAPWHEGRTAWFFVREAVHSTWPGELAVTFSRPHELEAFVLIGPQTHGRALRSDEAEARRDALRTVGLEWQALRRSALPRLTAASAGAAS